MRVFQRIAALALVAATISGCAGPSNRNAILKELDPAPMSDRAWAQAVGTYSGPIRISSLRGGFEGASSIETRLDLTGWADDPQVYLRMDTGFSTAWAMYGERKGDYTNIPTRRYGTQGMVFASTHAPDQLLLQLRRHGFSAGTGAFLILTFRGNGTIEVEMTGHSGWRGDGELWRAPVLPGSR